MMLLQRFNELGVGGHIAVILDGQIARLTLGQVMGGVPISLRGGRGKLNIGDRWIFRVTAA